MYETLVQIFFLFNNFKWIFFIYYIFFFFFGTRIFSIFIISNFFGYLLYPNLIHKFFNSLLNIENIGLLFHPNDILIESHSLIHYDIKSKRSKLKINFGPLFRKILISNLFLRKIKKILSL
jgi:hypothetical protein